jgi:Mor family transcriptional regulator
MSLRGQIADLIGADAAERLCHQFGGISYYIPAAPTPEHKFLLVIDSSLLAKICSQFGGTTITLPKGRYAFKKALIVDLLAEGKHSVRKIASIADCTERYVSRIRSQAKANQERDLPLFRSLGART